MLMSSVNLLTQSCMYSKRTSHAPLGEPVLRLWRDGDPFGLSDAVKEKVLYPATHDERKSKVKSFSFDIVLEDIINKGQPNMTP